MTPELALELASHWVRSYLLEHPEVPVNASTALQQGYAEGIIAGYEMVELDHESENDWPYE